MNKTEQETDFSEKTIKFREREIERESARRAGSDGSMFAFGSVGPGFDPRRVVKPRS